MKNKIAGFSMKGGKGSFFCCLLEFFPNEKRWFLRSLFAMKDRKGDGAIGDWIKDHCPHKMVVDYPLSVPACQRCDLVCPGMDRCPQEEIKKVRFQIEQLLEEDEKMAIEHPADYERKRTQESDFFKSSCEFQLSRAFKRRLHKGIVPYLNRAVDFWIWCNYYDQLLTLFNISYDSFGSTSATAFFRFSYLRRHFSSGLELFEGSVSLCLIEFLRANIISKKDIKQLVDLDSALLARLHIVENIERELGIFIYQKDLDVLLRNPRAFDSFMLALGGLCIHEEYIRKLPVWTRPSETKMAIPSFS